MSASNQELLLEGLVEMTNAEYHAASGISKSHLDAIAPETGGSPLGYWDAYINPDREPREETHAFAVGSGTHALILEPSLFTRTYGIGFDKSAYADALDLSADLKRECTARGLPISGTKGELADRLIADGFPPSRIMLMLEREHNATMAGRTPISAADYKNMLGMLHAVSRHHTAAGLILDAYVEQSYFVTVRIADILGPHYDPAIHGDPDQLVQIKIRPDIITRDGLVMPDLKTTEDVSKRGFGRTMGQRRYFVQGAWYLDVMHLLYGDEGPQTFCFIAAQKRRPYDVAVHWLNEIQIAAGRDLYQRDLARIIECRRLDYWPGADNGRLIEADIPQYMMSNRNEENYSY